MKRFSDPNEELLRLANALAFLMQPQVIYERHKNNKKKMLLIHGA